MHIRLQQAGQSPDRIATLRQGFFARVPRSLALIGTLLFTIAYSAPWLHLTFMSSSPNFLFGTPTGLSNQFVDSAYLPTFLLSPITRQLMDTLPFLPPQFWQVTALLALAGAVPAVGLLLCPILWSELPSRRPWLGRWLFGGWTLLVSVMALLGMRVIFSPGLPYTVGDAYDSYTQSPYVSFSYEITWAVWLMLVALGLLWLGTVLLFWQASRGQGPGTQAAVPIPAPRTAREQRGAWLVTGAILLWEVSFFGITWVSGRGCKPISIRCAGQLATLSPLSSVSRVSAPAAGWITTLFFLLLALGALVAGGGLLVVLLVWQRGVLAAYRAWVLVWLTLATVFSAGAALSLYGVIRHESAYSPGPGLPLALLALCGIWASAWLRWRNSV